MNNKNTIINAILAVAVVVLFILHFTNNNKSRSAVTTTTVTGDSVVARMPIAYIELDSLINNYKYANQVQEELMREMESRQATVNQKGRNLENEMRDFQKKVENNAFFDQARAQREQERILKLQQQFQELNQKLQMELMQLEADKMKALSDTIMAHVEKYNNEVGRYQMIFTNKSSDNIIHADPVYDITTEVTQYLNDHYAPAKEEDK
ncbi:MAG: OmpH family outer membrane protein [Porphyromonas sp.]|nr:OmpH family outer membrane protein [Porphyromonas sp.]